MTTREVARKPTWQSDGKRKRRPRGRPKGTRISVPQSEQLLAVKRRLGLNGEIRTYRDVAQELTERAGVKVGLGTVYRFVEKGEEPRSAKLREAFGLLPLVELPVCPQHGVVHVRRCRPAPPEWVMAAADWLERRSCASR